MAVVSGCTGLVVSVLAFSQSPHLGTCNAEHMKQDLASRDWCSLRKQYWRLSLWRTEGREPKNSSAASLPST